MIELIEANWLLILLAVLVGFVVAWFLLSGSRKTKITREESSDEPAGAKRNQALIDAPPASAKEPGPPPAPKAEPAAPAKPTTTTPPAPPKDKPAAPADSLGGAGAAVGTAAAEKSPAAPASAVDGDDLTKLKGVGPKLALQLNELGVTSFAQIAAWSEADIDRIDDQLGRFKGRIRRDNWIEQARLLTSGDTAAYEAQFGKL
ncbi:helix-hairpin-helix domain-containing protein [Citromicrobium bathyomarinum]|uniref:helix-hairpin-helix domain-containing protein n=1 Tax=Citromicrobium bathyomarinum TaxID=72174 RepID=UPI003159D32C